MNTAPAASAVVFERRKETAMVKGYDQFLGRSEHALSPEVYGAWPPVKREEAPAAEEGRPEVTTAVVVVHGMGQQLEFQTLDQVERGLRRVDPMPTSSPTVGGILEVGSGKPIPRIELELHCGPSCEGTVRIHAFECYWAPLTEGRVTLRDVMSFLWHAGFDGLRNAGGAFGRWMFGGMKSLPVEQATAFWLNCTLIVLAGLVALNAVIAGVGAARLAIDAKLAGEGAVLTLELLRDLSVGMAILLGAAAVCVAGIVWLRWMGFFWLLLFAIAVAGPALVGVAALHRWSQWREPLADWAGAWWPAVVAGLLVPIAAAFLLRGRQHLVAIGVRTVAVAGVVLTVAAFAAFALDASDTGWWQSVYFVLWSALLVLSRQVRTLLVQYVGDVAVYVSPHRLDRFHELRDEIKNCVARVMQAVFEARDGAGGYQYERVFVVGHSLGSVAAYDVVNRMLLADALDKNQPDENRPMVRDRLKLLLTFGSPLDKTAFVFRRQAKEDAVTREVLAAMVQPMIYDQVLRNGIPWLNVHSRKDIVSGPLSFYDDPAWTSSPPAVENVEDPAADVPIMAHVQYWLNNLVFRRLHQAIVCDRAVGGGQAPPATQPSGPTEVPGTSETETATG